MSSHGRYLSSQLAIPTAKPRGTAAQLFVLNPKSLKLWISFVKIKVGRATLSASVRQVLLKQPVYYSLQIRYQDRGLTSSRPYLS